MNVIGMILFIIFMLASVVLATKMVLNTRGIVKNVIKVNYKKELKTIGILVVALSISFTLAVDFIFLWANLSPKFYEVLISTVCALLFSFNLSIFYVSFRLHYYRTNLPRTLDKMLFIFMIVSIPLFIITLWYGFNGFAPYLTYPIINGINIPNGITTAKKGYSNGLTIAFYALCIISGAVFVYFLCDHKMYQQYGKHGTLESTFLVAFPSGIIGARIWYVIGNWKADGFGERVASGDWWAPLAVWEGGLTILGGAIMGIVVGVLWYIWRNKHYSIWVAVDMIVPTILLAQAIGRIGNFFNCEVHGNPVDMASWWFLPKIILLNGTCSSSAITLTDGTFYLPLFLIEGILNVCGYFLISTLFGKVLRKYTELGDLAFGYVLTYGLIRVALEPLRHTDFNMGEHGYWSWIFSCLFIVFGALGILGNHLIRYLIRIKKNSLKNIDGLKRRSFFSMIILLSVASCLVIGGIILMALNEVNMEKLTYNLFNVGVMLLCIGSGVLIISGCPIIYYFEGRRKQINHA